jgi:hypothetical protein
MMIVVAVVGLGMEGYRRRLVSLSAQYLLAAATNRLAAELFGPEAVSAGWGGQSTGVFPDAVADHPEGLIVRKSNARRRAIAHHLKALPGFRAASARNFVANHSLKATCVTGLAIMKIRRKSLQTNSLR